MRFETAKTAVRKTGSRDNCARAARSALWGGRRAQNIREKRRRRNGPLRDPARRALAKPASCSRESHQSLPPPTQSRRPTQKGAPAAQDSAGRIGRSAARERTARIHSLLEREAFHTDPPADCAP